ncbi:protein kinase domain protein [Ichthyophthirius multifiliis]|uniref:Protein kinase domain protein n=1 Tax=Ichthyophthirius multifiliis TaxID=5932 RepID=G0QQJ2_ICHMU|nr:protein kinase domain protein [Ichthyophthirius multifiliis]EGR32514.1 protein kinase domain protein [Ichthyophthirius multifiliis]|eukprot:XP_004036500.1 protein kinase domain protein [Ichthyophthirius multifiliis]
MKMLKHKNIVQLYDVIKTENNLYMIVEYCNQGNLQKYIYNNSQLKEHDLFNIMFQIMEGFQCLHNNNIVHRDLKLLNVLLNDQSVKIADFGFSKVIETGMEEPILVSFVGTPLYMSPQVLQQQSYSSKTDIWSLGILYYEILYKRTPWEGKNYFDLLQNILNRPLQFPDQPFISKNQQQIITKMLQIKEEDRINWIDLFKFFEEQNRKYIIEQIQRDFQLENNENFMKQIVGFFANNTNAIQNLQIVIQMQQIINKNNERKYSLQEVKQIIENQLQIYFNFSQQQLQFNQNI